MPDSAENGHHETEHPMLATTFQQWNDLTEAPTESGPPNSALPAAFPRPVYATSDHRLDLGTHGFG
jgi:hypothetical protein